MDRLRTNKSPTRPTSGRKKAPSIHDKDSTMEAMVITILFFLAVVFFRLPYRISSANLTIIAEINIVLADSSHAQSIPV